MNFNLKLLLIPIVLFIIGANYAWLNPYPENKVYKTTDIPFFWHTIGNKFLTFLSNVFSNMNLTDMETCYKLFKSEYIKGLELKKNRFGFELEVTAKITRIPKIRIYEVGISYYGRTYEEGKKIGWKDGFRAIYCILKYNIFSK